MTRMERWIQAAATGLGGGTALVAVCLINEMAQSSSIFRAMYVALLVLLALTSLALLLLASLAAVPARRTTGWIEAMEEESLSWRAARRWVAKAYGRGMRLGLGFAAAMAVVAFAMMHVMLPVVNLIASLL